MRDDEIAAVLKRLLEATANGEAIPVQRKKVETVDFVPGRRDCHQNVHEWVAAHPEHRHVMGYLQVGAIYIKHSVVEFEDGTFSDITPAPEGTAVYPFISGNEEVLYYAPDEFRYSGGKWSCRFGASRSA